MYEVKEPKLQSGNSLQRQSITILNASNNYIIFSFSIKISEEYF